MYSVYPVSCGCDQGAYRVSVLNVSLLLLVRPGNIPGEALFTLCEYLRLVPQYLFVMLTFDDTKIMKSMLLPSQCEI